MRYECTNQAGKILENISFKIGRQVVRLKDLNRSSV